MSDLLDRAISPPREQSGQAMLDYIPDFAMYLLAVFGFLEGMMKDIQSSCYGYTAKKTSKHRDSHWIKTKNLVLTTMINLGIFI